MQDAAAPKERLFQTAARLFYQSGYRATGVDTIASESGIGKMTLYRHFPSKDDLIVAYLRERDQDFWRRFEQITSGVVGPREKLLVFFAALQDYVLTPACYGCPFLNVATEYPESGHAGHLVAMEHKLAVKAHLGRLAEEAGAVDPGALADALLLLMDGAYMASRLFGATRNSPGVHLEETARRLLDSYCDS
jgi:AcrR family transcriptional regulator